MIARIVIAGIAIAFPDNPGPHAHRETPGTIQRTQLKARGERIGLNPWLRAPLVPLNVARERRQSGRAASPPFRPLLRDTSRVDPAWARDLVARLPSTGGVSVSIRLSGLSSVRTEIRGSLLEPRGVQALGNGSSGPTAQSASSPSIFMTNDTCPRALSARQTPRATSRDVSCEAMVVAEPSTTKTIYRPLCEDVMFE